MGHTETSVSPVQDDRCGIVPCHGIWAQSKYGRILENMPACCMASTTTVKAKCPQPHPTIEWEMFGKSVEYSVH